MTITIPDETLGQLSTLRAQLNECDAAVLLVTAPQEEPSLRGTVYQAGDIGPVAAKDLGQVPDSHRPLRGAE